MVHRLAHVLLWIAAPLAVTVAGCSSTAGSVAPLGCEPIPSRGICQVERVHRDRADLVALGGAAPEASDSLRWAHVTGCGLPSHVYAWDDDDVYVLEAQSCGGDNCGAHFTGYGWTGLGVEDPSSFEWLSGGYARDDDHVYNRYTHGPLPHAEGEEFEVMACEPYGQPIGSSRGHFYEDGRELDGPPAPRRG